ncbi:hypothetical protein F7Q99_38140 [Streptomyces kaniharaensis]|uniref:Uncharacterized protein n=1 Tax=Streptomyces kaniharaensis TaxID=212423 RepID=A0A6N7L580_9ACTN|nr:hypothetical protein [Streptomyces kaniharaensis]MQS17858.1 hypothetical protein [Streptomyces kaniharaensis]
MITAAASTPASAVVVVVVVFCLVASGSCLLLAIIWANREQKLAQAVETAKDQLKNMQTPAVGADGRPLTPVQAQSGQAIDFSSLAKLADALEKLPVSGRLLIVSLGFATIAAVAAGTGSIASAVS